MSDVAFCQLARVIGVVYARLLLLLLCVTSNENSRRRLTGVIDLKLCQTHTLTQLSQCGISSSNVTQRRGCCYRRTPDRDRWASTVQFLIYVQALDHVANTPGGTATVSTTVKWSSASTTLTLTLTPNDLDPGTLTTQRAAPLPSQRPSSGAARRQPLSLPPSICSATAPN